MNVPQKEKKKRKSPIKDWRKAKEKEKKNYRSKIRRKQKKNIQKGHWTRQCLNDVWHCHKQKEKAKEKEP